MEAMTAIRKAGALALLCGMSMAAQNGQEAPADPWKPLRFLIGTWDATTKGGSAGAAATGAYTFQLELKDHVLARHAVGAGCKGPADFNCEHTDMLYVYQEGPGEPYRAIYFDNEGHVIRYVLTAPAPDTAVFLSDAAQPGPQFRLTYELKERVMTGKFQMRMPGQAEFRSYLEWSGGRK
jgi:hypothetical protein